MTSKGKQEMGKTVITRQLQIGNKFKIPGNPSQTYEVVDIKGDYLIYRNVRSHEEFQMVRGFATKVDLVEESATYQKKRFKEPYYMYNESAKTIKESSETKKDYLKYIDQFEKDVKKYIDWMKRDVKENKEIVLPDVVVNLATAITNAMNRYNNAVKTKTLTEGFMVKQKLGNTYIGRFDSKDKAEKAVKDLAKRRGQSEADWLIEPDDKYMAAATAKGSSSWGPIPMNTLVEDYALITDVKVGDTIIYHGKELKVIQKTPDIVIAMDDKGNATKFNISHFNEPIMIKESVSKKNIKSADDLYDWLTEYMRKHSSNRFTTLQIILGNGNNITFAWDMKAYKGIHEGNKDYTMTEFVYNFMDPVIKNSGISDIWEVDMDTGRFKPTKESFIISDTSTNNKPVYFRYGKYTGYDWGFDKNTATKFSTIEAAERMIEKMRQEGVITDDMKVIKESVITESKYYIKKGKKYFCNMNGDPAWGSIKDFAIPFNSVHEAEKYMEKMSDVFPMFNYDYDIKVVSEGRIAKGYENLDADEKARHLLSHPSSKYMNDLKSENITERAIRKAVKEMLGKPDKRDPQFIIDVNEEGEAPAIANTTAEVANPDLPLKLKEGGNSWEMGNGDKIEVKSDVVIRTTKDGEKFMMSRKEWENGDSSNQAPNWRKMKEDLESDKAEALEDYKKAKAEYLANKSDENWKKFSNAKSKCMQLGCRI